MADQVDIRTDRLLLRRWQEADRQPWAAMCADPEVMRHFPATLSGEEADGAFDRFAALLEEHGYGLWAVERIREGDFIGFVGLNPLRYDAPFTPAVEIGWRLAAHAWNQGYATEAARAALAFAFDELGLEEVVSVTVPDNVASRRVMAKLGMTRDAAGDFDHPNVADGSPLKRHVLYRIQRG